MHREDARLSVSARGMCQTLFEINGSSVASECD